MRRTFWNWRLFCRHPGQELCSSAIAAYRVSEEQLKERAEHKVAHLPSTEVPLIFLI